MGSSRASSAVAALFAVTCLSYPLLSRAEHPRDDCGDSSGYQAGAPWPAYQRCSTRIGITGAIGARTNVVNWSRPLLGSVRSPVVAADGTIFVGAGTKLFAFTESGQQRWESYLWGNIAAAPAIGADGTVYVVSAAGALAAVNPANGVHKWVYRGAWGTAINTSPLLGSDGTIYFVDTLNFVHAVNANGTPRWVKLFPGPIFSSLTMSRDGQSLYIGSSLLGLRAIKVSDGNLRWLNTDRMGEYSAPTVGADGTIYVGSLSGDLYALSPLDGRQKFKANHKSLFSNTWGGISVSPAVTPEGDIVFGTDNGLVVKLSAKGAMLWEKTANGGKVTGSPAVDGIGTIYVGTENRKVVAFNPNGSILWTLPTGGAVWSAPAIGAKGTVYVGANDSKLYSVGVGSRDPYDAPPSAPPQPSNPIAVPGSNSVGPDGLPVNPTNNTDAIYCAGLPTPSQSIPSGEPYATLSTQGWASPRDGLTSQQFADKRPNYPVSDDGYFRVDGLTPATVSQPADGCNAHLCQWKSEWGTQGTQVPAADESNLLREHNGPSEIPPQLFVPCEAVTRDAAHCRTINYDDIHYDQACAGDEDCDPDFVCASVCPEDPANPGAPTQCALAQPDQGSGSVDARVNRCAPVVVNENCVESLVADNNCYTMTECSRPDDVASEAEIRPDCGAVPCDTLNQEAAVKQVPTVDRTYEQRYDENLANELGDITLELSKTCPVTQSGDAVGKDDLGGSPNKAASQKKWGLDMSAGFSSHYKSNPGPFGIVLPEASAEAHFGIVGRVMGRSIDVFTLSGEAVANLKTPVVNSDAKAKIFGQVVAKVQAGADLQHGVTVEGSTIPVQPDKLVGELQDQMKRVGATAKARLAQVTRIFDRVVESPDGLLTDATRTITRDLCKKALGVARKTAENIIGDAATRLVNQYNRKFAKLDGKLYHLPQGLLDSALPEADFAAEVAKLEASALTAVSVDPICDAPLTQSTAKLVLDQIANRYEDAAQNIGKDLQNIFATSPQGQAGPFIETTPFMAVQAAMTKSAFKVENTQNGDGYSGSATISGIQQKFSIIGATAVFPIGPVALVLEIQGTGFWGIEGAINYGFTYNIKDLNADKPLTAFANANVVPYAGVDADAYVGVGFDFGIGGASVGINGQVNLVKVAVPVGGGVTLSVEKKSAQDVRPWPAAMKRLSHGSLPTIQLATYAAKLTANVQAGVALSALSGEVSLALRVRLLFFKKTWRKKLASFAGYTKTFNWVGSYGSKEIDFKVPSANLGKFDGLPLPSPDASYLPAFPFPKLDQVDPSKFTNLWDRLAGSVPPATSIDELGNFMLSNADFFGAGKNSPTGTTVFWDPRDLSVDPWAFRGDYPTNTESVRSSLASALQSIGELTTVPPECGLKPDVEGPIIF